MADLNSPQPPEFIKFLFSGKPKFDCHFMVGDESLVKPEKIGAVKLMLEAHSPVFRCEFEEKGLRVKDNEVVPIKDIYPDTFRNLLKYVYGYDSIKYLKFDELDNLFYAADKYMIPDLKQKLAKRLIPLITPENICSLLNNPVCRNDLLLKSNITHILSYETDQVLASPKFLEVCADGFVAMLEMNCLAVAELELWRAAVKWAKHNTNSDDCQVLRQQLCGVTQHIRVCTLSSDEFCSEVVPTGILSDHDVVLAAKSIGEKTIVAEVTSFSNKLEPRENCKELLLTKDCFPEHTFYYNSFDITTKKSAIELLPFRFLAWDQPSARPEGSMCPIGLNIKIIKYDNRHNGRNVTLWNFTVARVEYGKAFRIAFSVDGGGLVLLPNTTYSIRFSSNVAVKCWQFKLDSEMVNDDFCIRQQKNVCPIRSLRYKVNMTSEMP